MGKTTLAQLVYNDDRVKCSFEIRMWVYVSEVFDVKRLLQEILQSGYGSFVAPSSLDQLHTRVRETLSGKRYLLVLDDVWNEDYENWSRLRACLKCGAMGSKIFVTTRSDTVASIMGTLGPHHLGALSEQDSWSLFKSMARPHPNFVSIGREIAAKCNGVPLALKALAGILAFSDARESWENVRRSNVWDTLHDHGFEVENVDSPPDLISQTRETSSIVIESEVLGRDSEKEELIHLLFDYENYEVLSVIPIVGLGGMGKTTLAQLVYNDVRVQFHFDIRKWVYVSEVFDVKRLLQEILQSGYGSFVAPSSLDQLHTRVRETLSGKRYLLVLDDVWNEDYENWSRLRACLNCGAMGSKILVTTRNDTVASIMGTLRPHHLGALSEQDSWSLFRSLARPHPNFVSIGREIAAKCNGVPLALKALARMLASSNARENWEKVRRSDVWDALRDQGGILPALKLSYDHLTPSLKQCFRTLPKFVVGEESGHGIEELKCLNQLSGDILIEGLDKIRNGEHAYEANLKGKRLLHSLELSWPSIEALANTENKAEEVIENLEPHSNLKKLIVDNYMGLNFPSWMMELSNLVGIKLSHCNECVHLPPLGQLRFLESLEIKELNAVWVVGVG
ncbi:hypothetical protein AAC387_Pa11g0092 [Persea americana]